MESLASEQISSLRAAINSKSEDTDWRALADSWKEMNSNISTTRQGMEASEEANEQMNSRS